MRVRNFQRERNAQVAAEIKTDSDAIIGQIRPLLADRSPMLQGAVIAELLAIFIGGHHPKMRKEMFAATVETAFDMIQLHDPWIAER